MLNVKDLSKYIFFIFGFISPIALLFFNIKLFLVIFVLLIFILQLIESFETKEFFVKKNILIYFLFVSFLSAIFSQNIYLSFVGSIDSFFIIFSLFLLFIFSGNILKKKEDVNLFISSICFGLIVDSIVIIASFIVGKYYSSIEPIIILVALALGISLYQLIFKKRKIELTINVIFSFIFICVLFVTGFKIAWFVASLFAFFIFWKKTQEQDFSFKDRKVLLSLIVFIFLFIISIFPNLISSSFDFNKSLSTQDSLNIVSKSITHNVKNFIFGAGPGTFNYNYALYFNKAPIPMTVDQPALGLLTILSDFGVLGLLIFIICILKTIKYFLKNDSEKDNIIFILIFLLFISLLVWKIEMITLILLFIFLGIYEGFHGKDLKINFKVLSGVAIIYLIMSIAFFMYLFSEELSRKAANEYKDNIDQAIVKMEKASSLFNVSDYYVGLSQLYLLKATDIFNNNWTLSEHFETQKQENKKLIEGLVSKSEVTAERATIIDPHNFIAWQNLALIYENTSFIINNNNEKALDALNRAIELSPNNYLAYIAKGRIYEELKEKELALEEYKKAFSIYPQDKELEEKIEVLTNF
ncbi:MAG: hypothetical protein PHD93_00030 [Candidatus Pacebacteria bacterium]|nr:hypothetical protein [Candidatus Paceibacterota bacterium]